MIDFPRDLIRSAGKDKAAENAHSQNIGDHLGVVIAGKAVAIFQQRRPEVIKTDQNDKRTEAVHKKTRPLLQSFLPIERKDEPVLSQTSSMAMKACRMESVSFS